ncbi:MAG: response regulator [Spirochaetota bacterium]
MITEKRILIAEDDAPSAELLKIKLEEGGYAVTLCTNGIDALAAYREEHYPLVITDLAMPGMSGHDLINEIKTINSDQVIIVTTMHSDSDIIIKTMKKGIYDYIVKPIQLDTLLPQVKRAFEADELYRTRRFVEHERMIKLENQIEWIQWNKDIVNRDHDRVDKALFQSLHNSFNQGAGFGALLSLINLIADSIEKDDGNYVVPADIFELIRENAKIAEKTLNFFSDLSSVMTGSMQMETIQPRDLYGAINELIRTESMQKLITLRNHTVILSDYTDELDTLERQASMKYLTIAMEELILNALKFSPAGTTVAILMQETGGRLALSVLNTPQKNDYNTEGIPQEFQNVVFEPFFRLVKTVYEDYGTLDYGLGLTLVDKIARKHNGRVDIGNVTDYTYVAKSPVQKVMVQIIF